MQEEWRQYRDTDYLVSNFGEVYSIKSEKILKPSFSTGYVVVNIWHIGKQTTTYSHRMVAETFLKNSENLPVVNHVDGNKQNNCVNNLEWCTSRENNQHAVATRLNIPVKGIEHGRSKLSEDNVLEIKHLLELNKYTQEEIAKIYKITRYAVSHINLGQSWTHITGWTPENRGPSKLVAKLTAEDIPKIRAMFAEGKTNAQIAKIYQTHNGTISAIRLGKNWKNY